VDFPRERGARSSIYEQWFQAETRELRGHCAFKRLMQGIRYERDIVDNHHVVTVGRIEDEIVVRLDANDCVETDRNCRQGYEWGRATSSRAQFLCKGLDSLADCHDPCDPTFIAILPKPLRAMDRP
jgi:hypothetical protein